MQETTTHQPQHILERLPQVLARTGASRTTWYELIKAGKAPKPVKLGARCTAWRKSDVDTFIDSLTTAEEV